MNNSDTASQRHKSIQENLMSYKFWSGIYIFIIAITSLYLVSVLLTSLQFQYRASVKQENDKRYSIWSIAQLSRSQADRRSRAAQITLQISEVREKTQENVIKLNEINHEINKNFSQYGVLQNRAAGVLKVPLEKREGFLSDLRDTQLGLLLAELDRRKSSSARAPDNLEPLIAEFERNTAREAELEGRQATLIRNSKDNENLIKELEVEAAGLKSRDDIFKDYANGTTSRPPQGLRDLVDQHFVIRSTFGSLSVMAEFPSELLTILLVLSMGALGSIIHLAQLLIADADRAKTTYFAFRPLFGALVALSVFVLVKAGVLVAASAAFDSQAGQGLNVFFLSFLGLVSGLLSDQFIELVRNAGSSWFRTTGADKRRWAVGIIGIMEDEGRKLQNLMRYLPVDERVVSRWLDGLDPVPADAQTVISAWLDRPTREIFSDIAPS